MVLLGSSACVRAAYIISTPYKTQSQGENGNFGIDKKQVHVYTKVYIRKRGGGGKINRKQIQTAHNQSKKKQKNKKHHNAPIRINPFHRPVYAEYLEKSKKSQLMI